MPAEAAIEEIKDRGTATAPDKRIWLAWLFLPCIYLVLHGTFVHARGPYYLAPYLDPDYAYLCNSLNLAIGKPPYHVHHPGTSVQALGAAVITIAHPFSSKGEKIQAVITRSEQHLALINFFFAALYAVSLVLVGITVWRSTGKWEPALLLQGSPFLLGSHFPVMTY